MVNYIKTDGRSTVEVNVEVSLIKDGEYVVAYCAALELSSYGITEDEAKGAFEGALETFLDDTHEKGTLERVLLDLGWSLKKYPKVKYQPPATKLRSQKLRTEKPLIGSFSERVLIPL